MKIIPELIDVMKEKLVSTRPIMPGQVHIIRQEIEQVEHMILQATCTNGEKEFKLMMDEPAMRGGLGQSPTPLGYFVAGAGG